MSKLFICTKTRHIEELIQHCEKTGYASVDFETTSLKYHISSEYALILGVSFQPGSSWIIPLGHKDSPKKKGWIKWLLMFGKRVIENPNIIKIAWNLKFEYKWFLRYGIRMKGVLMDAMLAKYCLDEERPHDLKSFAARFYPQYASYEEKISPRGIKDKDKIKWADKPFLPLCEYCGIDSDITLRGMLYMEPRLIRLGFYNLFRNLLMMATRVLGESEYRGIRVNRTYLEDLMGIYKIKLNVAHKKIDNNRALIKYERKYRRYFLRKTINKVRDEIESLQESDKPNADRLIKNREGKIQRILEGKNLTKKETYGGFNPGSPDQLREFLFTSKFGLKLKSKNRTESGKLSTDEDTLESLKKYDKTKFLTDILAFRGLAKLDSTYISGIHPLLDRFNYVHAGFKINGTVTGRLSCADPNLQNIPRDTTASDIKKMFIPPPGYVLLEVDYGQAELRLIAELAKDKVMLEMFTKGYNIHVATACLINGGIDQYDEVKKIIKIGDNMSGEELAKPENKKILKWMKEKKRGKSLNFSIIYGQGDKAMAEELDCTPEEAGEFKRKWLDQYPDIRRWMRKQIKFARKNGYVPMLFGRKRRLHDIDSDNFGKKSEAERQAINAPIQGTSSDFGLFSLVIIREKILKGELPVDMMLAYTVHDSLGFYVRPEDVHGIIPILYKICRNPDTIKYFGFELKNVEMKVSPELGIESWGDLNEYHEEANYRNLYTEWERSNN